MHPLFNRQSPGDKPKKPAIAILLAVALQYPQEDNFMNDQVSGVVRHVLTIAAGVLIQRGLLDESSAEAIVGGVIAILGVAWSWRSKVTPTA